MDLITLRSGPLGLVLVPAVGGAIARFWSEAGPSTVELLRPAPEGAAARCDPWSMASFPLVPWSNRICEGRFAFGGRRVSLAPNHPPERHAIHGLGFRAAWTLVDRGPSGVTLEHHHPGDAWPWPYRAAQRVTLTPVQLTLELALTNEGDAEMPAGLGWHPYFPRPAETVLTARVAAVWLTDAEVMPVALVTPAPDQDPSRGLRVDRVALDNVFTGWDGQAFVAWPERGVRLRIAAGPPLGCLVVYTPRARPFFCVEPVSHVTDAFNLAAGRPDTGMLSVAPGETVRASVTFTPEVRPAARGGVRGSEGQEPGAWRRDG